MTLEFVKSDGKLIAANDETYERVKKMPVGESVFMEWKPKRNYKFHKKLFSLLNYVFENQEFYKSIDNLLEAYKFRAGYFETIVTHKGVKHYKAKSISFHSMDGDEFEKFYSSAIDTSLELIPMDRKELEDTVLRYL
jgi:hypothetical protein